jgi:hypothetical protein
VKTRKLPPIPIWKLKHPKAALQAIAVDVAMFNRGYRMEAIDPGALKFPSFKKCYQSGLVLSELHRRMYPAYIGVDLAGPKRAGNAIVVIGLEPQTMKRYLLEARFGAWSSPTTAGVLAEVASRHNVQYIQVENNAYQQALIDWVKKEKPEFPYWMKIEPYTTGFITKADEHAGLPALEVEFKNEGWVVPSSEFEGHPPGCVCDWCRIKTEVENYPKGSSTDGLMALFFARDAANKWAPRPGSGRGIGNINVR